MTLPSPKPDALESEISPQRKRWFWIVAVTLLPLLMLGLLELGLWVAGYGYPTRFFVHHPAASSDSVVENQRFSWRFFARGSSRYPRPVLISKQKPPGTYRIIVFGESAAQGDPDPAFSFARILQVLLSERYPGVKFEVINLAFTAINSHVILPIARESAALQGDLWLVYMGNNEVVGPFGAGSPFGRKSPPLLMIRAALALKTTRTGQWVADTSERLLSKHGPGAGWGGMTMMLGHQVRQEDPRTKRIYRHFQKNLEDLLSFGRSCGVKVVVSTMVANLRDSPPFASLHRSDLTEPQRAAWEKAYRAGMAAEAAGQFDGAIARYGEASQIDDTFAELHFRWGRCALALGKGSDSAVHFQRACDLDTLRFRADAQLNEIIRQVIQKSGTPDMRLLDAEAEFSRRSRDGITGDEWLYEHVHFNFQGNYLLARLFGDQVAQLLPEGVANRAGHGDAWLSESNCVRRLAWNDYSHYWSREHIRQRMELPPFTSQLGHAERLRRWETEIAHLQPRIKPAGLNRAATTCRAALAQAREDWVLHDLLAFLLANLGDSEGALAEWRRVSELIPHYATPYCEAGKTLEGQKQTDKAIAQFAKALEANPDYAEAHFNLGMICARQGRKEEAIHHLRETLRLDPGQTSAKLNLERILRGF